MSSPVKQLKSKIKRSHFDHTIIYSNNALHKISLSSSRLTTPETSDKHLSESFSVKSENLFDIDREIQDFWTQIDKQLSYCKLSYKQAPQPPKAIRIFVSSTFTDFFNEREELIKQVFPELKEWCTKRGLDLVECDLRWGVPKDSTNEDTILSCLEELDRCYNDNGEQIFFIGLISERYGWIPDYSSLNRDIIEKYKWIPKASITFMEIMHGALRKMNSNACFFIRTSESLDQIPKEYHEKFFESDEFGKEQIKILKDKLKEYLPSQVFEYNCKYDSIDESTGRKKVKLSGFKEFSEKVLSFFQNAIEKTYPDMKPLDKILEMTRQQKYEVDPENIELMNYQQKLFITEKTNFYIDRDELDNIIAFIGDKIPIKNIEFHKLLPEESAIIPKGKYLILTGSEGCGKATLLAQLCKILESDEFISLFYHFFGASIDCLSNESFAQRFVKQISSQFESSIIFEQFNTSYNETEKENIMRQLFEKIGGSNKKHILVFDGFDKRSFDSYNRNLSYFPVDIPENVTCIVSCDNEIKNMIESLQNACVTWFSLKVPLLCQEKSRIFIRNYFDRYNKKLDENQLSLMLKKSNEGFSPLWLNFACHELKIFGEFTTLNKKIENLPNDLYGIIADILERVNKEFGNNLVKKILCLLKVSAIGIPENEISDSFRHTLNLEDFSLLKWSQISRNLRPFLTNLVYQNVQLISLAHNSIDKVVDKYLIENKLDFNEMLADFYEKYSKNRKFACYRITHHLYENGNKKRLVQFLKTKECMCYMQHYERARLLNKMRCKIIGNRSDKHYQIMICALCATKVGQLSWNSANKTSCFICGGFVFGHTASNVVSCLKHYDFKLNNSAHATCVLCKIFINENSPLRPVPALLCHICNIGGFCHFIET